MDDVTLRRNLREALDPGAGFPSPALLSRTVTLLDEAGPRHRLSRTVVAVAAAIAVLLVAAGALALHIQLLNQPLAPAGTPRIVAPPTASSVTGVTLGPDGMTAATISQGGGKSDVYLSADGGRHWRQALQLPGTGAPQVHFFDRAHAVIVANPDALRWNIYVTSDGGKTWQHQLAPERVLSVCFVSTTTGWALESGPSQMTTIYQTRDGGRTWTIVARPDSTNGFGPNEYAQGTGTFACWDSNALGIVTSSSQPVAARYHYSLDGGRTWQSSDLPSQGIGGIAALSMSRDGRKALVLSTRFGSSVTSMFTSADGGRTWRGPTRLPGDAATPSAIGSPHPPIMAVTSDGWWVLTPDQLVTSTDGLQWSTRSLAVPDTYPLIVGADFTSVRNGWIVFSDQQAEEHDVILATTDGGASWHQVTTP